MKIEKYLLILIVVFAISCKKPYTPPAITAPGTYLVVEGVINSGSDSTIIKLSHTVKLSQKTSTNPELNAVVTVDGDQNVSYPLVEMGNGRYASAGLNLNSAHKYRLNIKTAAGAQYLSDYVEVVNSPPIDSISFDTRGTPTGPGLNIYANTHDQNNKARYFRWDYQQTWIIHANFESRYKSNGDTVLIRDLVNDNIYTCWLSDTSSSIVLGSSAKLSQNVILANPITSIVSTAEKLGDEYSILVKQYALTPEAYNFYTNLKKNTEQLGSIFDAQPSQIKGNIHSVANPLEPVIGYVSVGNTSSKRIFIKKSQLPFGWGSDLFYNDCELLKDERFRLPCCYFSIYNGFTNINQVDEFINFNKPNFLGYPAIPISAIVRPGQPPVGYTAAIKECADCTLRGTNIKPGFWK